MSELAWDACRRRVLACDPVRQVGRVTGLVGMTIEVRGLSTPLGSICRVEAGRQRPPVFCEAVGFHSGRLLLMPYGSMQGIAPGQAVVPVASLLTVPTGARLLGRVLNGLGEAIDGGPPLHHLPRRRLGQAAPSALHRRRSTDALTTGVRAIDTVVTVARGQRMGIFAGSGVGKSVLLGMLARGAGVDVNVLALIGERGREVREFIERDLGPDGLARSVVVVVTSDESAVMRAKGAETAMTIAESFREADREVLFLMDSITRYAMALREIGLAAGEPPTTKGYPPSVFAALPRLCERAGWSAVNAMTAFFTVLIEGDDINDPIGDAVRSILDGHVMLSRDLAREGHYPAIDVLGSVSRLRNEIIAPADRAAGDRLLRWLKALENNRDLVAIGAYAPGSDPLLDAALAQRPAIRTFLTQGVDERHDPRAGFAALAQLVAQGEA
ncbi:MAG TPA: FliI/YscN family ATPase [Candidatus Krumholzibacteria bacterium]|nr:FliI/YscN family ATPase [Candidatus Krumholzibacteria bacterium]HPD71627.1 FliI/YscN family ATPase [Candidatus Krumholzibacteria bacterium]HRY41440.1 FliI/YscN family ATPase [Candidatus Krumholzibacteria bacterium]